MANDPNPPNQQPGSQFHTHNHNPYAAAAAAAAFQGVQPFSFFATNPFPSYSHAAASVAHSATFAQLAVSFFVSFHITFTPFIYFCFCHKQ